MTEVFADLSKLYSTNRSHIAIIPKVTSSESFSQFRPINLCSLSYKVVTKIVASRLQKVMEKLVSCNQCSFVLGRISSDNILVVQEVIHLMKGKKGKFSFMEIKVDLEKTYDILD